MNKDLCLDYRYKIELHAHTKPVSECGYFNPIETVLRYHDKGVHGLAIANHLSAELFNNKRSNNDVLKFFLCDYCKAYDEGLKRNMKIYLSAELRFPEPINNENDYLVYGINEAWIERIINNFPSNIQEYIQKFTDNDVIIIQAHPFRVECTVVENLDGYEGINTNWYHNSNNDIAMKFINTQNAIVTIGSDFHQAGSEGLGLILTKDLPNDSLELARLLKKRDYLLLFKNQIINPYAPPLNK